MTTPTTLSTLTADLTQSMKKPTRKTLTLINRALSYLTPFESPKARPASPHERRDLLALLTTHRHILIPYIDTDRIETNLLRCSAPY